MVPWALVSAIVLWGVRRHGSFGPLPHLLVGDLVTAGALMLMTGGGTSAFFPFLIVPAFSASVLYGRPGMFWSGAGALAVYIAMSLVAPIGLEPRTVIARIGVLIVIWSLIAWRADHEARTTNDLEQLATWPRIGASDLASGVRELLAQSSSTLRAPRMALLWEDVEGTSYVARYDARDEAFTLDDESVADALPTIDAAIRTSFTSQTANGWLLAIDPDTRDEDQHRLAEIVARFVSAGLDQINLVEMLRDRAAADERLRVSRDLHDGLLQTLGGLAMHAQSARRVVANDARAAEKKLEWIVEQLTEGQRSLRDFVEELRPELTLRREPLHARLERLAQSIATQWNVAIDLDASRGIESIDGRRAEDVVALVAEALTNAARHAAATRIEAVVSLSDNTIHIDVSDNGRGFPFHGRHTLQDLVAAGRGPWSLKERVTAAGGELAIASSEHGARVEMKIGLRASP